MSHILPYPPLNAKRTYRRLAALVNKLETIVHTERQQVHREELVTEYWKVYDRQKGIAP